MIQLNEKDIIQNCKNIIFNRGLDYYRRNNVSFLSVDFSKNITSKFVNIDAAVWGSYGSLYDVVISIDSDKQFKNVYCDCEYHATTGEICKHIVAVLLKYINDYKGKFSRTATSSQRDTAFIKSLQYNLISTTEKTPLMLEFNVDISKEAFADDFSFSMKVGTKKLYVIKDIKDFLDVITNSLSMCFGNHFTYDPFEHYFNVQDQKIIDFLVSLKEIDDFYPTTPSSYKIFRGKTVFLPQKLFKQFLDLLGTRSFNAKIFNETYNNISIHKIKLPLSFKLFQDQGQFVIKNDTELPEPLLSDHSYYFFRGMIYNPPSRQIKFFKHFFESFNHKNEIIITKHNFQHISSTLFPSISELCSDIKVHKDIKEKINTNPLSSSLYLDRESSSVSAKVIFTYGSESFNPFSKNKDFGMIFRNMSSEQTVISLVESLGFNLLKNEKLYMDKEDDILNLINYDFDALKDKCTIYYSENFKKIRIRNSTNINTSLKLNESNLLEFSFNIEDIDKTDLSDLVTSLNLRKKYFRLKDGSFLDIETSNIQPFMADLKYLGIDRKELKKESLTFPKYKALSMERILKTNESIFTEYDVYCKDLIDKINKMNECEYEVPHTLNDVLRDYQKTGFSWLKSLSSCGFGGILADEMGLGKTLQAITYIYSNKSSEASNPALIIAPTSLVYNWESEFKKFAPSLSTLVINGNKPKREALIKDIANWDVIITSYPLVRSDVDSLSSFNFSSIFIDEAQYIKNPQSQSAVCVKSLISSHKFALTGTPIENNLSELWSIFDFIMPEYLGSYNNFRKTYEVPISKDSDTNSLNRLNRLIQPFILRRHKTDVVNELPPKITKDFIVELNDNQRRLYASFVNEYEKELDSSISSVGLNKSKFKLLSILTRLRQICCDPSIFIEDYEGESSKLIALMDILKCTIAEGHRVLIFSQFTKVLKNISPLLVSENINHFYLDGSTPSAERLNMVNKFNAGENDVFLISLKAGGTGLNLIGADTVIHFDPWWNPAVELQATDRSHRIGQLKTVEVIRLIAKGTIEEKISELKEKKQSLFDNIVENASDQNLLKTMNEDDIRDLFR